MEHCIIPKRKRDTSHWVDGKRPKGSQFSLTENAQRSRLRNPEAYLCTIAKHRAKKKGLDFNITKGDFKVPPFCPILGIPLEFHFDGSNGGKPNSPSLDRIDNSKGYVKGNVQVISLLANTMKSYASKEQLLTFAKWILLEYSE
jgi:hypothetical protein